MVGRSDQLTMDQPEALALNAHLGAELHRRSSEITRLWLERLMQRLDVEPQRIFPSETLLNHIPEVLKAISDYLVSSGNAGAEELVQKELATLARLRREQGYDVDELLAEFDILGELLYAALREEAASFPQKVPAEVAVQVSERLYRALMAIARITAATFRAERTRDRRERARLLGSFGRDLAHELRNRLSAAEASLHVVAHDVTPAGERTQRAMSALGNALRRIKGVADDVHALAIAQGSEESAQGRRLSLRKLITELVVELNGLAPAKGVTEVQVDATRVELVLINLVGNAIKYCDEDKTHRWVRIAAAKEPAQEGGSGHWRVSVSDNGVGISDEMKSLVFEQFVRAHPDIADGTGLGLAIARAAVEQLHGRIWVETKPAAGSTFYFTLVDPPSAHE
jgi:signal transduction histidine kinase